MSSSAFSWLPRHKLTVAEFYKLADAGILGEDDRVELIDGEIIDMTPIGSRHAGTVLQLAELLRSAVARAAFVWIQNPIRLDDHTEPQPDLALLRPREDFYKSRHPEPADVLLVVEVADHSSRYDRELKLPLYARHGIPEVWLVDLETRRVEIYRGPRGGDYLEKLLPEAPGFATLSLLPQCSIDLALLF